MTTSPSPFIHDREWDQHVGKVRGLLMVRRYEDAWRVWSEKHAIMSQHPEYPDRAARFAQTIRERCDDPQTRIKIQLALDFSIAHSDKPALKDLRRALNADIAYTLSEMDPSTAYKIAALGMQANGLSKGTKTVFYDLINDPSRAPDKKGEIDRAVTAIFFSRAIGKIPMPLNEFTRHHGITALDLIMPAARCA